MYSGTLIAESLRAGTTLESVPLTVTKIVRHRPVYTTEDQPPVWTNIDFEVADDDADALASALSAALDRPGWYTDFRSAERVYVVFPGRVFSYPRGNGAGRAQAHRHGRAVGVPDSQLDWPG